ncbi:hypothetical protein PIB30_003668 [Stylosanthes scabra]|uniref:Uncharacterized protein n=1 Tax=Stylosanthes scabra TaxID=79078 RepID=A0ABU6Z5G0_9FABA|nr:hypothetical protein [Stylosanthes scabra]
MGYGRPLAKSLFGLWFSCSGKEVFALPRGIHLQMSRDLSNYSADDFAEVGYVDVSEAEIEIWSGNDVEEFHRLHVMS